MLWQRVVTALVLVPLVVAGVLLLPTPWFAGLLAIVLLLTADEAARMLLPGSRVARLLASLLLLAGMLFCWAVLDRSPGWYVMLAVGAAFWVVLSVVLFAWRRTVVKVNRPQPGLLLLILGVLLVAWLGLGLMHDSGGEGAAWVLVLMVTIWLADSLAYFAGRQWGTAKLAPALSPGKTWAGFYGALLAAPLMVLAIQLAGLKANPLYLGLLLLLTVVVSIAGDLFESLVKRRSGVKDSGTLLPGHGGVFDRIDSLVAASAVFVVGLDVLEVLA